MSNKRVFEGISRARFDKPDQDKHVSSIAKNIAILTGQTKNKQDRAILYRDLKDLGLVGSDGQIVNINNIVNGGGSGGGGDGDLEIIDTPTKPTNVTADAGFSTIIIRWDFPAYLGHKHTEIWRNTIDSLGDMEDPRTAGEAVLIGTTPDSIYVDSVNFDTEYYYWVRFVNLDDEFSPVHSANGLYAKTKKDIQTVINEIEATIDDEIAALDATFQNSIDLSNQAIADVDLKADGIINDITTRVDVAIQAADDKAQAVQDDVANRVDVNITNATNKAQSALDDISLRINGILINLEDGQTGIINDLTVNYYTKTQADSATQGQLTTFLTAVIQPNYTSIAFLESNYRTEVDTDLAITSQINTAISQIDYSNYATLAFLESNYRTQVDQDSATTVAINTAISNIDYSDYATLAFLESDYRTKVDQDSATTTQINTALSQIDYSGFVTTALLTSDYRTKVDQDVATTQAIETAISQIDNTGLVSVAFLESNYRTEANTDLAITSEINTALSQIDYSGFVTTALLTSDYRTKVDQDSATTTAINTAISNIDYSDYATIAFIESDYRTKVTQDSVTTSQINTAISQIDYSDYATIAFIESDYRTRVAQDSATTSQINTAISQIDYSDYATIALLTSDYRTSVDSDVAIASQIDIFKTNFVQANYKTSAQINIDHYTKSSADTAISQAVETLESEIFNPDGSVKSSFISEVRISDTDLNGAISTGIDNYSVSYDGGTYSIAQVTTATVDNENNYTLQWGVKSTVGALNHGIGFISQNGQTTFAAKVDSFAVYNPVDDEFQFAFSIQDGTIVANKAIIGDAQIRDLIVQNKSVFEGDVLVNSKLTGAKIEGAEVTTGDFYARGGNNGLSISPTGSFAMWYGQAGQYNPEQSIDNRTIGNARFALKHDGTVFARGIDIFSDQGELIMSANGVHQGGFYAKGLIDDVYDSLLMPMSATINLSTSNSEIMEVNITAQNDFARNFYTNINIEHPDTVDGTSTVILTILLDNVLQETITQSVSEYPNTVLTPIGCYIPASPLARTITIRARRTSGIGKIPSQLFLGTVFKNGTSFSSYSVNGGGDQDGGGGDNDTAPVTQDFISSTLVIGDSTKNFNLTFTQDAGVVEFELTNVVFTKTSGVGTATQTSSINDTSGVLTININPSASNSNYTFTAKFRCRNATGWSNQSDITITMNIEGQDFGDFYAPA